MRTNMRGSVVSLLFFTIVYTGLISTTVAAVLFQDFEDGEAIGRSQFTYSANNLNLTFSAGEISYMKASGLAFSGDYAWTIPAKTQAFILFHPPINKVVLFLKGKSLSGPMTLTALDTQGKPLKNIVLKNRDQWKQIIFQSKDALIRRLTYNNYSSGLYAVDDINAIKNATPVSRGIALNILYGHSNGNGHNNSGGLSLIANELEQSIYDLQNFASDYFSSSESDYCLKSTCNSSRPPIHHVSIADNSSSSNQNGGSVNLFYLLLIISCFLIFPSKTYIPSSFSLVLRRFLAIFASSDGGSPSINPAIICRAETPLDACTFHNHSLTPSSFNHRARAFRSL